MVPRARETAAETGVSPPLGRSEAEHLIESTYRKVYAALYKMTGGDGELAADLTQDTYRKAWQSLGSFNRRSSFWTWLYRIAYNTFLDHLRRPRPLALDDNPVDPHDPSPSPFDLAHTGEVASRLRRAVLDLPEGLRFTITARYWGELSAKDIAAAEGISRIAVYRRLRRAHSLLRAALEDVS